MLGELERHVASSGLHVEGSGSPGPCSEDPGGLPAIVLQLLLTRSSVFPSLSPKTPWRRSSVLASAGPGPCWKVRARGQRAVQRGSGGVGSVAPCPGSCLSLRAEGWAGTPPGSPSPCRHGGSAAAPLGPRVAAASPGRPCGRAQAWARLTRPGAGCVRSSELLQGKLRARWRGGGRGRRPRGPGESPPGGVLS